MAGTIVADTIQDGAGNSTAMDNAIYGSAKAWVRFNSSSGSSCTIQASYNVSSVTYISTGLYTINFTNAFVDTNYILTGSLGTGPGTQAGFFGFADTTNVPTTTSCSVYAVNGSNALANYTRISAAIFR